MTEAEWGAFQASAEYADWHNLHQRTALGEPPTPEEQARYESVKARLDAEEDERLRRIGNSTARTLRRTIADAEANAAALRAYSAELAEKIRVLEARLDEPTRRALSVAAVPSIVCKKMSHPKHEAARRRYNLSAR